MMHGQAGAFTAAIPTAEVYLVAVAAEPSWPDERILSVEERRRADRFAFGADRSRFVTGRAALRRLLASKIGTRPEDVPLIVDGSGRPGLGEPNAPGLDFNLSHSSGLVAIALAAGRRVGVDVEARAEDHDLRALMSDVMGPRERDVLRGL